MKSVPAIISLFLFLVGSTQSIIAQDLLIKGGWLVQPEENKTIPNPGIFIRSGKIFEIGSGISADGIPILELEEDDYLLPGLIDLHAHYRITYKGLAKDDTVAMPKIFLASGTTTTFPAGEVQPYKMKELRESIDRGERPGPRILNSGPYFGRSAPDWDPDFTEQDITDRVDYWAEQGVMGFKAKNITPDHLKTLINRAHQHGLTVTGHLNSGVGNSVNPEDAILMGIDRVEHFLGGELIADSSNAYNSLAYLDSEDPLLDKIIDLYVKHGVYFDATIGTYGGIGQFKGPEFDDWIKDRQFLTPFTRSKTTQPVRSGYMFDISQGIYPVKRRIAKRYFDAGGLITLGTDRPFSPSTYQGEGLLGGFFIHREMEILVNSGIPEAEVLKIATIHGARAMGLSDRLGSIEISKWADMIVIKGDPLENIRNTRTVHTVIKGGVLFDTKALMQMSQGKLGPQSEESWFGDRQ
ncbi:amidohydrolase family protein [Balneola sp. MJW-20]|uniref:amidohydrolase family protein n=1 Tax=Gracilimonas aurantiaca TaxID=3234185 RepID=UPI0034676A25